MPNFIITPVDHSRDSLFQRRIDQKTKPPGALGLLEPLALQIAALQQQERLSLNRPVMLVFAADHGIARYGVSIAPQSVTGQMVENFVAGGAAVNVFCRQLGWQLQIIDAGIVSPLSPQAAQQVTDCRLGRGTQAFHLEPAMSVSQVEQGFALAKQLVAQHFQAGSNVIGFGEMGIGNTSAASALMSAMTGLAVTQCVGRGTGVDDKTLQLKTRLIEQALQRHRDAVTPLEQLACLGGFEIVLLTGSMLAAAERGMLVVVDGFIATAAAMVALRLYPQSCDYLVFSHQSGESGHGTMLKQLQVRALLQLDMRLGEGSGAALALPLLQAAVAFYNDMASFADAGVADVSHRQVTS